MSSSVAQGLEVWGLHFPGSLSWEIRVNLPLPALSHEIWKVKGVLQRLAAGERPSQDFRAEALDTAGHLRHHLDLWVAAAGLYGL